jgi:FixJ family two-component response regulator
MTWVLSKHKSIHLITGDGDTRDQIMRLLSEIPAEVKIFETANAFLDARISEAPACLITEVKLNDIEGIKFIQQMREHGLSTPVIVLADGDNSVNTAVKAIQSGASDFIEKPIVERDFIERVQAVLRKNK